MQTARDATILTILILIFASVRIGPIAEDDGSIELPQVQTAGIGLAPPSAVFPAVLPPTVLPVGVDQVEPPHQSFLTADNSEVRVALRTDSVPLKRWVQQLELNMDSIEVVTVEEHEADDEPVAEVVVIQVAEWIEEISEAAIAGLGDTAREAVRQVECPKSRFKVSTGF